MSELVVGAIYRHYKGKDYRVFGVVKHSETLEELVHYECLYENAEGQFWVRPKDLFLGTTVVNGEIVPRFAFLPSALSLMIETDVNAFLNTTREFLESHEAHNGLMLGLLEMRARDPVPKPAFMAMVTNEQGLVLAAYYSGRNLVLSPGPEEALSFVVDAATNEGIEIEGVVGPPRLVEIFGRLWCEQRSCVRYTAMNQAMFKLTRVEHPTNVVGQMRPMRDTDLETVATWMHGFMLEAVPHEAGTLDDARKNAQTRVNNDTTFLWEVDGRLVSLAALSRPTAHGFSVNAVYTPPEHRRQGYASAVVAAVSEEGLKRGKKFCVLYTDLANPTSNSIYQKIGYRRIGDSRNDRFKYST